MPQEVKLGPHWATFRGREGLDLKSGSKVGQGHSYLWHAEA